MIDISYSYLDYVLVTVNGVDSFLRWLVDVDRSKLGPLRAAWSLNYILQSYIVMILQLLFNAYVMFCLYATK